MEQVVQVEQVQQEQSLSMPNTLKAEDLKYTMYALVQHGKVTGYSWAKEESEDTDYVLMTFENSPAWIGGRYSNGTFYQPE